MLRMAATYGEVLPPERDATPIDRTSPPGRAVVDGETIHVEDLAVAEEDFLGPRSTGYEPASGRCWLHHCYVKMLRSGQFIFAGGRSAISQTSRLNCLRPSPTRP